MDNQVDDGCRLFSGSSVFLALWRVLHISGKSSSVKLPFYDVGRHVKKMRCEDHGDPEGVAVLEEGQEVCCSGLRHVLTSLEGHRSVFLGSLLPRHVPTKKNGSEAVLEVEAEDNAEGGAEDGREDQILNDVGKGAAFHACPLFAARRASHAALCAFLAASKAARWGYEGDTTANISLVKEYRILAVLWYSARACS
jgi:hypothetical protein